MLLGGKNDKIFNKSAFSVLETLNWTGSDPPWTKCGPGWTESGTGWAESGF